MAEDPEWTCIEYEPKTFKADRMAIIRQAEAIIREWARKGYDLTLRQLYYQFVARTLIPNNYRSYKRLGEVVNDARLAGLLPWNWIVDRTRNLGEQSHWDSPEDMAHTAADSFATDLWKGQRVRPEVWIEKDALIGIVSRVCTCLDVPYFACIGYVSQSEMWKAAQRLNGYNDEGKTPYVFYLGDHDPSGLDMTRDIDRRLALFCGTGWGLLNRIALTRDQIDQLGCPPNPVKVTDKRWKRYVFEHGPDCWELDALPPDYIENLIKEEIEKLIDLNAWSKIENQQIAWKEELRAIANNYDFVMEQLRDDE